MSKEAAEVQARVLDHLIAMRNPSITGDGYKISVTISREAMFRLRAASRYTGQSQSNLVDWLLRSVLPENPYEATGVDEPAGDVAETIAKELEERDTGNVRGRPRTTYHGK